VQGSNFPPLAKAREAKFDPAKLGGAAELGFLSQMPANSHFLAIAIDEKAL